ncbi:MAG: PAS domain S-box protein [Salinivirgaceae bacterium]|nr:PAS domain S-box protein [Salinivirgaceae bacterium]
MSNYRLEDLVEISLLQDLQYKMNLLYPFSSAIIDTEGKILSAVAWQDICTKFHRKHPLCEKECIKSDKYINYHLHKANPALSYFCPHGLVDNAIPIIINKMHLGSFFTGQYFLEKPNLEFFKKQAKKYKFDENEYIEAVKKVPILSSEKRLQYFDFIKVFIEIINEIGLKNLKLIETNKILKESEKRFSLLYETAPFNYQSLDKNACLIDVNPKWLTTLGYKREEVIGCHFSKFLTPESAKLIKERFSRLIAAGEIHDYQFEMVRKDGSHLTVSYKEKVGYDELGNFKQTYCIFTDLTMQKQIEHKLKESEEKYRLLFITSPDSISINSMNGIYIDVNESFTRIMGYTRDDVIGKSSIDLNIWNNLNDRIKLVEVLKEKGYVNNIESTFKTKNDSLKSGLMSARLIKINNNTHILSITQDITERKLLENLVKKSEEKYHSLFTKSNDAMFLIDKKLGTYLNANKAAEKITGYSLNNLKKLSILDITPTGVIKSLRELATLEHSKNMGEIEYKRPDGSTRKALLTIVPATDDKVFGIAYDITERILAKEKLYNSEKQFRLLLNSTAKGIYGIDAEGNCTFCNDAALRILEYSDINEVLGKNMHLLIHHTHKNGTPYHKNECKIHKAFNQASVTHIDNEVFWKSNGTNFHAEYWSYPTTYEGKITGSVVTFFDITKRKHYEKSLLELSRTVEQSSVSIVITDINGNIEYVNPKFTKITGYLNHEVLGKNPSILKSGHTSSEDYQVLWKTITSGNDWQGEFCNLKKNSEKYWENALISPVINDMGEIINFIAVKEDITKKKEMDRKILSALIEGQEQERNRFSRDIHDGLGPLLSSIKIYFQLLSETNDPDIKKLIILKGNNNINEAIKTIREVSNNLSPSILQAFGLISTITGFIDGINQLSGVSINFIYNTEKRFHNTIETSLYRIIMELINNSLKYANAKQININIEFDETIKLILVKYTDDGKGFDLRKVQKQKKGRGLLNINNRVSNIKGKINMNSSKGLGFEARIEVPVF